MGRVKDWLVAGSVLALGRRRRRLRHREPPRVVEPHPPRSGSELVAAGAFVFAAVCAVAFIVVYALDRLPAHIQLLGLCLGLCLASIAVAFYVLAMRVVPEEELEGTYEETKPEEQLQVERIVAEGTDTFTRRRLLGVAAGGAAGALALVPPVLSLGPFLDTDPFYRTPWRRGRRLVDGHGKPLRADDIEEKAFY